MTDVVVDPSVTTGITQDIRDAMTEKSKEFADHGNQIYLPITT